MISLKKVINKNLTSVSTNKSRSIWYTNNCKKATKKRSEEVIREPNISGELVGHVTQMSDHFNSFVTTVTEETLKANNPSMINRADVIKRNLSQLVALGPTSQKNVKEVIYKMITSNSFGVDKITSTLMKMNYVLHSLISLTCFSDKVFFP